MRQRPLSGADVAPWINQREQAIEAVLGALHLLLERSRQEILTLERFGRTDVAVERKIVEVVGRFTERVGLERLARKRERHVSAAKAVERGDHLVAQEA